MSVDEVALGRLMVSVLAVGPKVRGFIAGRGRWIYKGEKIRCTASFRGQVIRRPHVVRFTAC
jgi:hypothetical protein